MKNLGEIIKELREKEGLPQRKLAHELNLDVSVLSKIENENRFPLKRLDEIIEIVAQTFSVPKIELRNIYLTDKIASLILYEDDINTILKVSEEKAKYVRSHKTKI